MLDYIGENDRFEIKKMLGKGGMGEVYKAYDTQLREMVAIKSISCKYNKNQAVIDMFLNEAKTSLLITHQNVIRVRDILFFEENYYLIMQFIDGIDLKEWMSISSDIKSRDAKKMYELIRPILEALAHAHQYTIHRDIKPANIMLGKDNCIYLMDFGIATVTKGSKIADVIKDKNMPVGTINYMPDEQRRGSKDIDKRVDIFAMGVVFYELLTRQKPNRENIALASCYNESVTAQLDVVILKMLASDPKDRYASCSDVIDDMDAVFSGRGGGTGINRTPIEPCVINEKNFVTIPKGNFYRGSGAESKIEVEKPRKKITLDSYRIGIYPVTNAEYLLFLDDNKIVYSNEFREICKKNPFHPVTGVTWDEALQYCKCVGGTLPTEAQWEKASKGTKSRVYPWGGEFNLRYCNIENSIGQTVSVDSFPDGVSEYGCYQMSGNIWEWCLDDFVDDFYKSRESKKDNPIAITNSDTKVLRGGSFDFVKSSARTSYRYYSRRNHKENSIGFRIVLEGKRDV